MADATDTTNVIIRPPIAWAVAALAGLVLNWLMPLPFIPAAVPAVGLGAMVFALALAVVAWAIVTMTRAGSNVPTSRPTTTIVNTGPYRFTRNPIYLSMVLGLIGLAIALNSLWLLLTLLPSPSSIRNGIVAREEAYLERKFGDNYRRYRARVRPQASAVRTSALTSEPVATASHTFAGSLRAPYAARNARTAMSTT